METKRQEGPVRVYPDPNFADINALFHRLWTKAAYKDDYEKEEWQKLRALLSQRGIHV